MILPHIGLFEILAHINTKFKSLDIKAYWNNKMWLTWAWTRVMLARLLMVYEEIMLTFSSIVRARRAILINESLNPSDSRALMKYQNSGKSSGEEKPAFVIGWSGCRQNQFWLILAKMSNAGGPDFLSLMPSRCCVPTLIVKHSPSKKDA